MEFEFKKVDRVAHGGGDHTTPIGAPLLGLFYKEGPTYPMGHLGFPFESCGIATYGGIYWELKSFEEAATWLSLVRKGCPQRHLIFVLSGFIGNEKEYSSHIRWKEGEIPKRFFLNHIFDSIGAKEIARVHNIFHINDPADRKMRVMICNLDKAVGLYLDPRGKPLKEPGKYNPEKTFELGDFA